MKNYILLSGLILAACSGGHSHDGIEISEARVHPPLPGQTTAVAFMSLDNGGAEDQLLAVTSPVSDRIELHTHKMEDGIMKMRRVPVIDLPAGRTVRLQPGGFHVMIFDAKLPADGEVNLTFDYVNGEDVTLVVPILPRGEMPDASHQEDHAGH